MQRPVTRDEFFAFIQHLSDRQINVHPSIRRTDYPYTSDWKLNNGVIVGVSEGFYPEGSRTAQTRYFLK